MDRATQGDEIRRLTAAPEVMLGSVHAVTETGSLIAASSAAVSSVRMPPAPARSSSSPARRRSWPTSRRACAASTSYAFPLEDARAMEAYGIHSGVNKVLIINREIVPGRITVVLVDEALGF